MKIIIEFRIFGLLVQISRPLNQKEQDRKEWERKNLDRLWVSTARLN